jgi:NhaA family Na+:H+ antiporter
LARKITLDFLKTEAASGAFLGLAALAALIVANSALAVQYFTFLKADQTLQLGPLVLTMALSDWVKEGLMSIFFLVVGLEIKYEILKGELSDPRRLATPVLAALGGMVGPALVYLGITQPRAGRSRWRRTSPSPWPCSRWWRAACPRRCGCSC